MEGLILEMFVDKKVKDKSAFAKDLKISRRTLYQYFKSKELEPKTKEKFEQYFGEKIFTQQAQREAELEAIKRRKENDGVSSGSITRETKINEEKSLLSILVHSNAEAIAANREAIANNKILAETNKQLADRVLSTTEDVHQQTFEAFDARIGNLLVSIAEVVTDKEPKSTPEVAALLHKAFHGDE